MNVATMRRTACLLNNIKLYNNVSIKKSNINNMVNQIIMSRHMSVGVDPKTVKIPLLLEDTKIEMYKKYKHDPINWSIQNLSNHYGTSLERTRAVIFLMQKRDEEIAKITKLPIGTDIPKEWLELYQFYDSTLPPPTNEFLSKKFKLDINQIPNILKAMTEHCNKLANVDTNDKFTRGILARLKEDGVDTNFRETVTETSAMGKPYFPELFGDDEEELEAAKKRLLKRIEKETKASLKKPLDVDDLLKDSAESSVKESFPYERNIDNISRWKFAYLDLSKVIDEKELISNSKLKGNVNENKKLVTIVRTRKGNLRTATPLEEAYRSWAPKGHISEVAMNFSKHKLEKYFDFDKDELLAKTKVINKLERYKNIKSQNAAK